MARVYLGVGSNIERERYISAGLDALAAMFGELDISPVYDSAAVGFEGQPFLNLVVGVSTDLAVGELAKRLRHIEYEHGRPPNATRFSARQLDIDILTYDDLVGVIGGVELPRGEILENAFVLRPLADLAPREPHPSDGRSYETLWRELRLDSQPVSRVAFSWRGRAVS
ncbi:2-amino-4-hydroxy-6-hydroxymethyldihydropteridine diphosphokinase [Seongchinamella sediminis]|uniref:2-amino-4-hydroxy-6-hydroxymethyldihydropteridine diphosphokinase n=1 Tax=Seongchinamella sediminis TaxID=2283635 RepID=A0A3L7DZC9_9GAMM|nr:2-amino-4-hydroxy-6-hydroxymethyldihydropteridine diphosphokinase [Seongchinamella sediminis]RLQ21192.1 2-amino-4-hydroxy-6-hydroxymethyldihydropteridine diphosphokinase [Seongchinamella sediminis]